MTRYPKGISLLAFRNMQSVIFFYSSFYKYGSAAILATINWRSIKSKTKPSTITDKNMQQHKSVYVPDFSLL